MAAIQPHGITTQQDVPSGNLPQDVRDFLDSLPDSQKFGAPEINTILDRLAKLITASNASVKGLAINGTALTVTLNNNTTALLSLPSGGSGTVDVNPRTMPGATFNDRFEAAVARAIETGSRTVVVDEEAQLTRALLLTEDNFTLKLHAVVALANGSKDNIIRVADSTNLNRTIRNVRIIGSGLGGVRGTTDSWGSDTPTGVNGESWRSIGVLLANVHDFEVSGLTVHSTNCWGICAEQCRYGVISNIFFDQTGNHLNQDGIDIRQGSHDIIINNIRGRTHDDFLALTNITIRGDVNFLGGIGREPGRNGNLDIYNIHASNLARDYSGEFGELAGVYHYWGGILLLADDGLKIRDCSLTNVTGKAQIYCNFAGMSYGSGQNANAVYNISITTTTAPIYVQAPVRNCTFFNVPRSVVTPLGVQASAICPAGSSNISRKYWDGAMEFAADGVTFPEGPTEESPIPEGYTGLVAPGYAPNGDPRVRSVVEDDTPGAVTYLPNDGGWLTDSSNIYSNNVIHYRPAGNGTTELTYYGGGFDVYSHTAPNYADVEVFADNVSIGTISYYSAVSTPAHRVTGFDLPEGIHHLRFVSLTVGGRVQMVHDMIMLLPKP